MKISHGPRDVGRILVAREHHDLRSRRPIRDSLQSLQAVRVGHPHIEQHDIGLELHGLLDLGLSNREIGRSLDISIETVKEHVQNVLPTYDEDIPLTNREVQDVRHVVKKGLV